MSFVKINVLTWNQSFAKGQKHSEADHRKATIIAGPASVLPAATIGRIAGIGNLLIDWSLAFPSIIEKLNEIKVLIANRASQTVYEYSLMDVLG